MVTNPHFRHTMPNGVNLCLVTAFFITLPYLSGEINFNPVFLPGAIILRSVMLSLT